jgi:hypothetical protein
MVFVRNWVDGVGPSPITQKVLSVVIGAGGVFRPPARLGVQIFGAQYAVVLGDLKTAGGDITSRTSWATCGRSGSPL